MRWTVGAAGHGVGTMCIGSGKGLAALFERIPALFTSTSTGPIAAIACLTAAGSEMS